MHGQFQTVFRRAAALGALAVLPIVGAGCRDDPARPITPAPVPYKEYMTSFFSGVAALDVGMNQKAFTELSRATKLIDGEPAGWYNLAIVRLRTQDHLGALKALEAANKRAPGNPEMEFLRGVIAATQGSVDEAITAFQKVVAAKPEHVYARYALKSQLDRRSGLTLDDGVRDQLEAILKVHPRNVLILLELGRFAAAKQNSDLMKSVVERLDPLSPSWPAQPRQLMRELKRATAAGDWSSARRSTQLIQNLLLPLPLWTAAGREVRMEDNAPGVPLRMPLRLPQPKPGPAPADTTLSYRLLVEGAPSNPAPWQLVWNVIPQSPPDVNPRVEDRGLALVAPNGSTLGVGTTTLKSGKLPLPTQVRQVDWNSDFLPDLVCAGEDGIRIFQQTAPGDWKDVTGSALKTVTTAGPALGCWELDHDLDGDLDVMVGRKVGDPVLLRNNSDGSFSQISAFSGIGPVKDSVWADLDGDADPDLALLKPDGKLILRLNDRAGAYHNESPPAEVTAVRAICVSGFTEDGGMDLVAATGQGQLYQVQWEGNWTATPFAKSDVVAAAALLSGDFDNNGSVDILISGAGKTQVFLSDAAGWSTPPISIDGSVQGFGDLNGDGRLDLVGISRDGTASVWQGDSTREYRSVQFRPRGLNTVKEGNQKINSFGVGGEIEARAGLIHARYPIDSPWIHIGVGEQPGASVVRVVWPNGQAQAEFDVKPGQASLAQQRLTGSCPWLFAWNGKSMEFVTDILWKSPLGLRINGQDTAGVSQTTDWVKVRGDQLAARGDFYELAVTAELWETDFFDEIGLMVVDHPKGTEIHIDERFAIPQPKLEAVVTGPEIPIGRATNSAGKDVTQALAQRDSIYADGFKLGSYQGVAEDHWLEIELSPDAPRDDAVLLANGWIFPTDSSINVALSQGAHPKPTGLSMELPDGKGGWKLAGSGLGFPAGKHKTIILSLDGLGQLTADPGWRSGSGPRRLRLRTNLEIYWDRVTVAQKDPTAELMFQRLKPKSAILEYRGFSRIRQESRSHPEVPEYAKVVRSGQIWPDLVGLYTRFGPVDELVSKTDDRYVIMNAGDQMRLKFPVLGGPDAGRVRDFIFVSDGWDKDGNFNTAFGQTVTPLPTHRDTRYDRPLFDLTANEAYRRNERDWQRYHTRPVNISGFRSGLSPRLQTGRPQP